MQITVACTGCNEPKRPLSPCPFCSTAPMPEVELHAWRITLHAHHLARITETPRPRALPQVVEREATPRQLVVVLDRPLVTERHESAAIIPLEPPVRSDEAKSFDWEDESSLGWLRRTA